jgi:hypothetical protein
MSTASASSSKDPKLGAEETWVQTDRYLHPLFALDPYSRRHPGESHPGDCWFLAALCHEKAPAMGFPWL